MVHLRLLTLAAFATRRTPVLPWMRCDAAGQAWVDPRVDIRTGLPKEVGAPPPRSPRACGWAFHSLRGSRLKQPLCIQRPLEGCFTAFATPDEIAADVPHGFWRAGRRAVRPRGGAPSPSPPTARLIDDGPNLTLDVLRSRVAPFALPLTPQHAPPERAAPSGSRLLLIETPTASALSAQPLLTRLEELEAAFVTLNGGSRVPTYGPAGWGTKWGACLKMVRNNRCAAVC